MSSTYDTFKPYATRALGDDDVKKNLTRAVKAARKVYEELSGEDAVGAARKVARSSDLRDGFDDTVQNLSEALLRVSGKRTKARRMPKLLLLVAIVGAVLFNPVTGPQTREFLSKRLFGSEDEFSYGEAK